MARAYASPFAPLSGRALRAAVRANSEMPWTITGSSRHNDGGPAYAGLPAVSRQILEAGKHVYSEKPLATLREYRPLAPWGLRDLAALAARSPVAGSLMEMGPARSCAAPLGAGL